MYWKHWPLGCSKRGVHGVVNLGGGVVENTIVYQGALTQRTPPYQKYYAVVNLLGVVNLLSHSDFTIAAHRVRTPFSWELQTCVPSKRGSRRSKSGGRSKTLLRHGKTNPNLNFLAPIFSGGVGVFHTKGWGPKKFRYVPSKPRESYFFGGISRDFAGISRSCPKSLRKKVWVQFSFPNYGVAIHYPVLFLVRLGPLGEGAKPKRGFSQFFADFWRFSPFPRKQSIWETQIFLLCLQKNFVNIFSCLPGNFALKDGGDFWWIFSGLRLPRNEARKVLEKFRGKFGAKFGEKFGTKYRKIRETFVLQLSWPKIFAANRWFSQEIAENLRNPPKTADWRSSP